MKRKIALFICSLLTSLWAWPLMAQSIEDQQHENVYVLTVNVSHTTKSCRQSHHHVIHSVSALFQCTKEDFFCMGDFKSLSLDVNHEQEQTLTEQLQVPLHSYCYGFISSCEESIHPLSDYQLILNIHHSGEYASYTQGTGVGALEYEYGNRVLSLTFPALELLKQGCEISFGCETLRINMTPLCKPCITQSETVFAGFPYSYKINASSSCENGYSTDNHIYYWEYSYEGLETPVHPDVTGAQFILNLNLLPDLPIGKNIVVHLPDGKGNNSCNTQIFRFYPQIPQPIHTPIQILPQNASSMDKLHLVFNRALNADMNEMLTKITVYDTVGVTGINGIKESRVIYQKNVNISKLETGNSYDLDIPSSCTIGEGKYYITVEGTVRGKSNHPDSLEGIFTEDIKNAIFRVIPLYVKSNVLNIEDVTFTPPSCHNGYGSVQVPIAGISKSTTPGFYWVKQNGEKIPLNFTRINNITGFGTGIYQYDSVTSEMQNFEIHTKSYNSMSGGTGTSGTTGGSESSSNILYSYFNIDFTQPEPLRAPMSKKDISGQYAVDGVFKTANDGYVEIKRSEVSGGTPPYHYYCSILKTKSLPEKIPFARDKMVLPEGLYNVMVEDDNGCQCDTILEIKKLGLSLDVSIEVENEISCYGGEDGHLVAVMVHSSSDNLSYKWYKDGQPVTTSYGPHLYYASAGNYKVEVTCGETGMVSSFQMELTQPLPLDINDVVVQNNTCYGGRDGKIEIEALGGTAPYVFHWDDYVFADKRSKLAAGEYTLTVTDKKGCMTSRKYTVTQPETPVSVIIDTVIHAHYDAHNNWQAGKVTAHAAGGTPPYGNIMSLRGDIGYLDSGTYEIFCRDYYQCQGATEVTVKQIPMLVVWVEQTEEVLCYGGADAACTLHIEGGIAPYTIQWSNGQSGLSLTGLQSGSYSVTVTDRVGAKRNATVHIDEPAVLGIRTANVQNPTYGGCMDGDCAPELANGIIQMRVTGGTTPYQYAWKKNGTVLENAAAPVLTGLSDGVYQLEVTDRNGCRTQHSETLQNTPPLNARATAKQNIYCFGNNTGLIGSVVSGGIKPYTYQWYKIADPARIRLYDWDLPENLLGTDTVLAEITAGYYGLKVTDENGVYSMSGVQIKQKNPLKIRLDSLRPASYAGSVNGVLQEVLPDGVISCGFEGGTAPYTYHWKDNPAQEGTEPSGPAIGFNTMRTGLSEGLYTLHLRDSAGCMADTVFELPHREPLLCSIAVTDSVSCYKTSDGAMEGTFSGGVEPFSITAFYNDSAVVRLSNLNRSETESHLSAYGLKSGWYALLLTDSNGVSASARLFLPQPDTLTVFLDYGNSPCFGDSAGFAQAAAAGGTLPYIFNWEVDGLSLADSFGLRLTGLENAAVKVSVRDRRGCRAAAQAVLQAPEKLRVRSSIQDPSYSGTLWRNPAEIPSDGFIVMETDGGTLPYSYLWNTGDTASEISGLDSGFYTVHISDSHGCVLQDTFRLNRIPFLTVQLDLIEPVHCYGTFTARLKTGAGGGVPPYTYTWTKNGEPFVTSSDSTAENLETGTYTVRISDGRNIISIDSFFVPQPEPLQGKAVVKDATAWHFKNGSVETETRGGTPPYTFLWEPGKDTASRLTDVGRGVYSLFIQDSQHCQTGLSVRVSSPDSLYILSHSVKHTRLEHREGAIRIHVTGGLKPYTYSWTSDEGDILEQDTTQNAMIERDNLAEGLYGFDLIDGGGAQLHKIYEVRKLDRLSVSLFTLSEPSCPGSTNAAIESVVQGGLPPYQRVWQRWIDGRHGFETLPDTTTVLRNIGAGQYRFFAYDALQDTVCGMTFIHDPQPMQAHSRFLYVEKTPGTSDGEVMVWIEGGKAPYNITWNQDDLQGENIFVQTDKTYTAHITDLEGCEIEYCLDSLFSEHMQMEIKQTSSILCHGQNTGALQLKLTYGRSPFKIYWSTGDTLSEIENLKAGTYTVEAEDALGRTLTRTFVLTEPPAIEISSTVQHPSCYGFNDGAIALKGDGGTGNLQYLWNTANGTAQLNDLQAGVYTVHIYDQNRCARYDTFTLVHPEKLGALPVIDTIECPYATGRIRWLVDGGTEPYLYAWTFYEDSMAWLNMREAPETKWIPNPEIDPAKDGLHRFMIQDEHLCVWDTVIRLSAPPYPQYKLDSVRYLCAGQTISLQIEPERNLNNPSYIWTYPNGESSFDAQIHTTQSGAHTLLLVQDQKCFYKDTVWVLGISDSIQAEFWMSSRIFAEEKCLLVNLSDYEPDSVVWNIPEEVTVWEQKGNYVEVSFPAPGLYTLGMTTYKGLCSEQLYKTVEVLTRKTSGKENPLWDENDSSPWRIYPNPSQDIFHLQVRSNENIQARYRIVSASGGQVMETGILHIPAGEHFTQEIFRRNAPAGLYIMMVEYGKTKRGFKLVKL